MASRKRKERLDSPGLDPAWFKLLTESGNDHSLDEVPPGWLTTSEIARGWGLSESYANYKIRHMVKAGHLEMKVFRVQRNVPRPVPHYRPAAASD